MAGMAALQRALKGLVREREQERCASSDILRIGVHSEREGTFHK